MEPVVVIGAGAAGIMAARRAAELGSKVILLEKTPRIGTKILISGGGKCNITHAGSVEDVLRGFRPNEARFLRPAVYRLTNHDVTSILTSHGLDVYARPDGRIFPVDKTAKDVVEVFRQYLHEVQVEIRLNTPVMRIMASGGKVYGVETSFDQIRTGRVILAVGGSSYPNSGTTGDGFRFAQEIGHSIVKIRAALAPISFSDNRWTAFSGIAIRDVLLKAKQQNDFAKWRGDVLLTHFGISGPCTLGLSREVSERREKGPVTIVVDLVPELVGDMISSQILENAKEKPHLKVSNYIAGFIPTSLIPELLADSGIANDASFVRISRTQRTSLIDNLKGWELGKVANVMLDKGEVVAGGVSIEEIDPQTMRSLRCEGLYLCGEVMDVAGAVGGYNLQAAFATGYIAGESAAND